MFTICRVVPVAGGGSVQSSTIFLHNKKMKVEQKSIGWCIGTCMMTQVTMYLKGFWSFVRL